MPLQKKYDSYSHNYNDDNHNKYNYIDNCNAAFTGIYNHSDN